MSKKYLVCKKPFWWYEVAWNNQLYLCCSGWLPKPVGNAIENDVEDLWRHPTAIDIRHSVIDGSFKYCREEFCPHLTTKTYPVEYVDEDEYQALLNQAKEPKSHLPNPSWLNLSYDKSCNLQCPTCRNEIITATKNERETYDILSENLLDAFGKDAKTVYITGSGDPFSSRHFWQLLTSDALMKYPNLELKIHTNALRCTPKRWKMIEHIADKIANIEVSIDAASANTYRLNRPPGNWDDLNNNMEFISTLRQQNKIRKLQIDFVVQDNNWHEMLDFISLGRKWQVDVIYFSGLDNWMTFTEIEHAARAVHRKGHKNNRELLALLENPIFKSDDVFLGMNLNGAKQDVTLITTG